MFVLETNQYYGCPHHYWSNGYNEDDHFRSFDVVNKSQYPKPIGNSEKDEELGEVNHIWIQIQMLSK